MTRNYLLFISDIISSIEKIERFTFGMNLESFSNDEKTISAVIREIEVIGEAVKQVPEAIQATAPQIPWNLMAKMRDKLIHWYWGTDEEIVWKVATERLPLLKTHFQVILDTNKEQ